MSNQDEQRPGAAARALGVPASTLSAQCPAIDSIEIAVDDAIEASFPASDPPSWITGTATVAPVLSAS
jgi:hypothetical protein